MSGGMGRVWEDLQQKPLRWAQGGPDRVGLAATEQARNKSDF
jgi:hypothetical protein